MIEMEITCGRSKEYYATKEESITCRSKEQARKIYNRYPVCWTTVKYSNINEFISDIAAGYIFSGIYEVQFPKSKYHTKKDEDILNREINKLKGHRKEYRPSNDELRVIYRNNQIRSKEYPVYTGIKELSGYLKGSYCDSRFLLGTQIIWLDIDMCICEDLYRIMNLLDQNGLLPTLLYTTFNDNTIGFGDSRYIRKFRLLYLFDEILNKAEAETIYHKIEDMFNSIMKLDEELRRWTFVDRNSRKLTQQYYGNPNRPEIINSEKVWTKNDFLTSNDIIIYTGDGEDDIELELDKDLIRHLAKNWSNPCYYQVSHDPQKLGNGNYEPLKKYNLIYEASPEFYSIVCTPSGELIKKWEEGRPNYLPPLTKIIRSSKRIKDTEIFQKTEYQKLSDGEHRRKRLAIRAQWRRLMVPSISPSELLYNIFYDMVKFTDYLPYSGETNPLDIDWIQEITKSTFALTQEQLMENYNTYWETVENPENRRFFERKFSLMGDCKSSQAICKEFRYEEYKKYINPRLTLKRNLEVLKANGINISERTLDRIIKEMGGSKKGEWKKLLTKGMKVKEAIEILEREGYNDINKETIKKYLQKLNNGKM